MDTWRKGAVSLAAIKKRLVILASILGMVLLSLMIIFTRNFSVLRIKIPGAEFLLLLAANILLLLLVREYALYCNAKLIVENEIMHIALAELTQESKKDEIEAFISCFGILLGARVIKFNIDGIQLKEVQIGHDFIYLVYGTGNIHQSIKLLHGIMDDREIAGIIERFRYETGIVPNVAGHSHMAF